MDEKLRVTTPKGELRYVQVRGEGKLDFNGKFREYTASICLPKKEAKAFKKELMDFFIENKPSSFKSDEPSNKLGKPQDDGTVMFTFRTRVIIPKQDGEDETSHIYIKNGKREEVELPDGLGVGNGSIGRIAGVASVYEQGTGKNKESGVSLWLKGIQLMKFVPYKPDDGFDSDEESEFDDFSAYNNPDFPATDEGDEKKKKKKKKK